METKLMGIGEAVGLIHDGDSVTLSGVSMVRAPMAFVKEIVKAKRKELSIIDREPGIDFDILIGAGAVKRVRFAMLGLELLGLAPNFRRAAEQGEIEYLETTCGAITNGLRAGAMGMPFVPVKGIIGTDLLPLHEKKGTWRVIDDPFSGEKIVAVKAIIPDVAVIHVQKADKFGNASIEGARFEDVYKAKSAKTLIITAEEIVDTKYFVGHPERNTIPYFYTAAVVHVPKGAYPTACYNYYPPDYGFVKNYVSMCRAGRFDEFIERWLRGEEDEN